MANLILKMKIMPESPEADLEAIKAEASKIVEEFEGKGTKTEIEPVAFGLKAIILTFAYNEDKGSTDALEEKLSSIEAVNSAEVVGIDRALG